MKRLVWWHISLLCALGVARTGCAIDRDGIAQPDDASEPSTGGEETDASQPSTGGNGVGGATEVSTGGVGFGGARSLGGRSPDETGATGGTSTGGRTTGGATTGGRSTGGSTTTGGRSTGGSTTTGGRSTGGSITTGGRATGGTAEPPAVVCSCTCSCALCGGRITKTCQTGEAGCDSCDAPCTEYCAGSNCSFYVGADGSCTTG
jgi:hypothetical protein